MTQENFSSYFIRLSEFESEFVQSRNIDVFLPASYFSNTKQRYPVLYMHDGQNLFDNHLSFSGISWGVGETGFTMAEKNEIPEYIFIGIWNTPARLGEYMPQKPLEKSVENIEDCWFTKAYQTPVQSDLYLKFIVLELKKYLDTHFRTDPRQESTKIMGSSMGGLISIYALCEYPKVFSAAGCLSASWTISGEPMMDYLREKLPLQSNFKIYVDYGIEEKVGNYKHYIKSLNRIAIKKGFKMRKDWLVSRFPGAEHSESAWRERLPIPFSFLLK